MMHSRLIERLMSAWGECFPMYAWTDPETAVDLMRAEITTLRNELHAYRETLTVMESGVLESATLGPSDEQLIPDPRKEMVG